MPTVGISGELEGVKAHLRGATTFEELSEIHIAIQRIVSMVPSLEGTAELSRVREGLFQRIVDVVPTIQNSNQAQEALGMMVQTVLLEPDTYPFERGIPGMARLVKIGKDSEKAQFERALDRLDQLGILAPELDKAPEPDDAA